MLDVLEIQRRIPHRFPFLMVDRILELEPGKRAVGLKNLTINEQFFSGHYPHRPIMPGVLMLEAMAQVGGLAVIGEGVDTDQVPLFTGIDRARFRRVVVPGDQLRIEVDVIQLRRSLAKCQGRCLVGDDLAAEAELMFVIAPADRVRK